MLIEELITKMVERSRLAYMNNDDTTAQLLEKAAEVIRLQNECIVDSNNEKWQRMIDEMGAKDAE